MEVHVDALAEFIRDIEQPVKITKLAKRAVRVWLERSGRQRRYAPGVTYKVGETLLFKGESATIVRITKGQNPKQGQFQIVTLSLENGHKKHMAAGVKGAESDDYTDASDDDVNRMLADGGLPIRHAVQEVLMQDGRFVWVPDELAGQWYLSDCLVDVSIDKIAQVAELLGKIKGDSDIPIPLSTETLVEELWGVENDGSNAYRVRAFSLEASLQRFQEFEHFPGKGWVLASDWHDFTERQELRSPRQPNIVPPATVEVGDSDDDGITGQSDGAEKTDKARFLEDFIAWQENRLLSAQFTLYAKHYYNAWLPLSRAMRHVFPPKKSQVTFYHRFGDEEASFPAIVDPDQRRILGGKAMYNAFCDNAVYPGAKLVVSHRGNLHEYDIRTKPVEAGQEIEVRRLELLADGTLEDVIEREPMRYEVDKYVVVGEVRWEDISALFDQADKIGVGIFTLMYNRCKQWEETRGAPLYVKADELYDAIHFGIEEGRPTAIASINWELWRRLAFKNQGDGQYLFRPEYGAETRADISTSQRLQRTEKALGPTVTKDRSLQSMVIAKETGPKLIAQPSFVITKNSNKGGWKKPALDFNSLQQNTLPSYFILQQRPVSKSEYEDRVGRIYNWKEGIPGSKQLKVGAQFVYYRPGEQVFFGRGHIASISAYRTDKGVQFFDGHIAHYEQWSPPVPLTLDLGRSLSFVQPERQLGVGQAGIRKISKADFDTILAAYEDLQQQALGIWSGRKLNAANELWQLFEALEGMLLNTLDSKAPFQVVAVDEIGIDIRVASSSKYYRVYRSELESVWAVLMQRGKIRQTAIRRELGKPNPTYVASLLAALPLVEHSTDPICLHMR